MSPSRRTTQLAIWLAAGILIAGATYSFAAAPISSSVPAAGPVLLSAQAGGDAGVAIERVTPSDPSPPIDCVTTSGASCQTTYRVRPVELLPAWRWGDFEGSRFASANLFLNTRFLSTNDAVASVFNFLAIFMLGIASLVWTIVLRVTEWAVSPVLTDQAAHLINRGFSRVSHLFLDSGLWWIVIVAVLAAIGFAVLRGKRSRVVSVILAVIIPLGALQVLTAAADRTTDDTIPTGSPAWLSTQATHMVDGIVGSLASGFGTLSSISDNPSGATQLSRGPDCNSYVAGLYDQYYAYSAAGMQTTDAHNRTGVATKADSIGDGSRSSVAVISHLWERAYLSSWVRAQFGSPTQAARTYCHQLEANAHISSDEQAKIGIVGDRYTTNGGTYAAVTAPDYVYAQWTGDADYKNLLVLAWAACYNRDGQWHADPAFAGLPDAKVDNSNLAGWLNSNIVTGLTGGLFEANLRYPVTDDDCSEWFTQGVPGGVTGVARDLRAALTGSPSSAPLLTKISFRSVDQVSEFAGQMEDPKLADQLTTLYSSYWGQSSGALVNRILNSFLALATAAVYAFALLPLAIGGLLAKLGFVLLMVLLPATLLLLAAGGRKDGIDSGQTIGVRLAKMTGGFFVAHLLIVLVLVVLLQLIIIGEALLHVNGGILPAFIPLLALFLLKAILSQVGLGNLTSLSGALSMSAGAALGISGERDLQARLSSTTQRLSERSGLDKLDTLAKQAPKRAGLAAWRGARWTAGAVAGAVAETAYKRAVPRNEHGELTGSTLAQLAARTTAAIDAAKGGRAKALVERILGTGIGKQLEEHARTLALTGANPQAGWQAAARDKRRELGRALAAADSEQEREQIWASYMASLGSGPIAAQRAVRDSDGSIITDDDGRPIFGWRYTQDGQEHIVTDQSELLALPADVRSTVQAIVDPSDVLSIDQIGGEVHAVADRYGLQASQIVASEYGDTPMVRPAVGGLVSGGSEDQTVEMARWYWYQYLPQEQKRQMLDANLSDAQLNRLLTMQQEYLGGFSDTGARIDVLAAHGIDVTTEAGRQQVIAHLEGRPSALDDIQLRIPGDVFRRMMVTVKNDLPSEIPIGSRADRDRELERVNRRLNDRYHEVNRARAGLVSVRDEIRGDAERHRTLRRQMEELEAANRSQERLIREIQRLGTRIDRLRTERTNLAGSAAPEDRARIGEIAAELGSLEDTMRERQRQYEETAERVQQSDERRSQIEQQLSETQHRLADQLRALEERLVDYLNTGAEHAVTAELVNQLSHYLQDSNVTQEELLEQLGEHERQARDEARTQQERLGRLIEQLRHQIEADGTVTPQALDEMLHTVTAALERKLDETQAQALKAFRDTQTYIANAEGSQRDPRRDYERPSW